MIQYPSKHSPLSRSWISLVKSAKVWTEIYRWKHYLRLSEKSQLKTDFHSCRRAPRFSRSRVSLASLSRESWGRREYTLVSRARISDDKQGRSFPAQPRENVLTNQRFACFNYYAIRPLFCTSAVLWPTRPSWRHTQLLCRSIAYWGAPKPHCCPPSRIWTDVAQLGRCTHNCLLISFTDIGHQSCLVWLKRCNYFFLYFCFEKNKICSNERSLR